MWVWRGHLKLQGVNLLEVHVRRHPAGEEHDMGGDQGGDGGVTIAVSAHPGGVFEQLGVQRQVTA